MFALCLLPAFAMHLWIFQLDIHHAVPRETSGRSPLEMVLYFVYLIVGGVGVGSILPSSQPALYYHGLLLPVCLLAIAGGGWMFFLRLCDWSQRTHAT